MSKCVAVVCIDCDKTWDREVKRGRPQLKCLECRAVPVIPVRKPLPQSIERRILLAGNGLTYTPLSVAEITVPGVVWTAWYKRRMEETLIGVYLTEAEAQAAVELTFKENGHDGFVDDYEIGRNYAVASKTVTGVGHPEHSSG